MGLAAEIQFSVVIPTYNRGALAARAVASALRQSKRPFEIIVVDDGSQDETRQLITAFGAPVKYVHQPNAGSAVARDNGIRQAASEWVALLDSDDIWLENHLERMAQAIQATNGAARFYFADTIRPDEKGGDGRWQACGFHIDGQYALKETAADWVLIQPQPMMLQSTVFNKDAYIAAGGFLPQLRYRDDTHLFLRLGLDGPVCAVANVGTQMTSDDDPSNRLTLTYDHAVRGAHMQVIMFEDLLQQMPHLPPVHVQQLQRRLAHAHLALARFAWRERQLWASARQMTRVMTTQPGVFTGSLQRNLQKLVG